MTIQSFFDCIWKNKRFLAFLVAAAIVLCTAALNFTNTTTAKAIIKFVGEDAVNGLTENGSAIDPYEMASGLVIKNAAMNLGYENINTEPIRRNMDITPITSTAEQEKYASWIENFSDYGKTEEEKETPIYYAVSLKTSENTDYARNMLYSIIKEYRNYYTKKYTYNFDVANLAEDVYLQYDYYEMIDLLKTKIQNNMDYLNNIISSDFDYRSYQSGYSIKDLIEQYRLLKETDLAIAEQTVMEQKLSQNYSVLISNLQNKVQTAAQSMELNKQKAESAKDLMDTYAKKNQEYLWERFGAENDNGNQVREAVERDDAYAQYQSTYDQLMTDYVEYRTAYENAVIDKNKYEQVIAAFEEGRQQDVQNADIESSLQKICANFNSISHRTREVISEYNEYRESESVIGVSGVIVESSANSIFYFSVCIIMALAAGIFISVAKELYGLHKQKEKKESAV